MSKRNYSNSVEAYTKLTMAENIVLGSVWVARILPEKSVQKQHVLGNEVNPSQADLSLQLMYMLRIIIIHSEWSFSANWKYLF